MCFEAAESVGAQSWASLKGPFAPLQSRALVSGPWGGLHLSFSTLACTLNCLFGGAERAQSWHPCSVRKHLSLPSRLYATTKAQSCTDTRTCTDRLVPSLSQQNSCGSWGQHLAAIAGLKVGWKKQGQKLKHNGKLRLYIFTYVSINHADNIWADWKWDRQIHQLQVCLCIMKEEYNSCFWNQSY